MAMCKCGNCATCKARAKKTDSKKTSPKNAKLAAMYGDKKKVTRGDVITAAKMKKDKK